MNANELVERLANQHLQGRGHIDWDHVDELLLKHDFSQRQVAKMTGISQSWISRKLRNRDGIPYHEMDAHKEEW